MKKAFTRTFFHFLIAFVVILMISFVGVVYVTQVSPDDPRVDSSVSSK